ncbi:MAG: DUF6498-containing protein [Pseudomonadota bacterium]
MSLVHPNKLTAFYAILANAIPLYGVLFWDWSIYLIFVLFWFENVVIGFFTLSQIIAFGLKRIIVDRDNPFSFLGILFTGAFFTVHYGIFTMGHGAMIFALFGDGIVDSGEFPEAHQLVEIFMGNNLLWAALLIILASAFAAIRQFSEHRKALNATIIMFSPYGRIIVLHIGLLFGGLAAQALGSPVWMLVLLIALKSAYDLIGFEFKTQAKQQAETT